MKENLHENKLQILQEFLQGLFFALLLHTVMKKPYSLHTYRNYDQMIELYPFYNILCCKLYRKIFLHCSFFKPVSVSKITTKKTQKEPFIVCKGVRTPFQNFTSPFLFSCTFFKWIQGFYFQSDFNGYFFDQQQQYHGLLIYQISLASIY